MKFSTKSVQYFATCLKYLISGKLKSSHLSKVTDDRRTLVQTYSPEAAKQLCEQHIPNIWCPQWGGSPQCIRFIFGTQKLEWLGYNLAKVARWSAWSFGHNTSTWQTASQPCRHNNSHTAFRWQKSLVTSHFQWMWHHEGSGYIQQPNSNIITSPSE